MVGERRGWALRVMEAFYKEFLFCLHHILFPGGQDHKGHQKLAGEIREYSTDEKLTCYSSNTFLYFLTKFEIEVKIIKSVAGENTCSIMTKNI